MDSLTDQLVSPPAKIFRFARKHIKYGTVQEWIKALDWHWVYGTVDAIEVNGEIIAVVRWNITKDGEICDVLDLVVKKGENGFRVIKHFIARNWHRFPTVKLIRYRRNEKYPNREPKTLSIEKILKVALRQRREKNGR